MGWTKRTGWGEAEMIFNREFEFTLPRGFIDSQGKVHRKGLMRLATAADEIVPMRDFRAQQNPAYLPVLVLARVIVRLGELPEINAGVIENLFTADMAFLQDMYRRINEMSGEPVVNGVCPQCGCHHRIPLDFNDLKTFS